MKGVKPAVASSSALAPPQKKILEDNVNNDEIEFIKGNNKELERISDFKIFNFIILLICILFVVIFLLIVIICLIIKKNYNYPKLKNIFSEETKNLNAPQTIAIEETNEEKNEEDKKEEKVDNENKDISSLKEGNDAKVSNDEVEYLKNMMKKSN